jgi:ATP-dependent RNA helicase HelY
MEYRGLELDPFQVEAIEHADAGRSVLVSAPTGTGKTIIADYIVEQALAREQDVIYTAPIKALSNQKYRDYTRLYGESAVGLITGDLVINRDACLRIMTTEILRNMLLTGEDLSRLAYVIIDEIHFLDDIERGTVWEEVLIYLPARVKILGLSATLANIREFADWLTHVRGEQVRVVVEDVRCVPLRIYMGNRDSGICDIERFDFLHRRWKQKAAKVMAERERADARQRRQAGQRRRRPRRPGRLTLPGQKETRHHELVKMLGAAHQPLLYFAFSRKMTETFARDLARRCPDEGFTTDDEKEQIKAEVDRFDAEFLKVMTSEQEAMYIKGIAFHHAGAHVGLKAFVEQLYERRLIKVLYCTSTFALGINMPARTVVFQALRKYNGHAVVPLTVRQFMQKAGRAGRRGIDEVGFVVILEEFADYDRDRDAIHAYLEGSHEKVNSSFNLSFNSVVNLLDRHQRDLEAIRDVIDKSFLNFHYVQRARRDRRRMADIAQSLRRDGWDPDAAELEPPPKRLAGRAKKWRRLDRAAGKLDDRVFSGLLDKVAILQRVGYLEEDLLFNAGAKVLKHLQIEEIFSTELVLSGLLDHLEPDLIFAAFCTLSNTFARTVIVRERPRGDMGKLARAMRQIRFGDVVRTCEHAIQVPVTFTPEMIPFGVGWYRGKSLQELMLMIESPTDVSGDLVTAFRRAKDLGMQLKRVYSEDPFLADKLRDINKTVSRDEVEVVS